MTDSKFLDTSVWIEYFFGENEIPEIENEEHNFISSLSLFEIKKKLLERILKKDEISSKIGFIKIKSIIVYPDEKICESAAEIAFEKKVPAMDSIIYASATAKNCELITFDNDFRGLEKAKVLDK